jgi:cytoskeletal protein RodZ
MTSYFVSPELSSFLGVNSAESIPRHEIERKILSYAKDKNIVSQQNPMVIRTDLVLSFLMRGPVFNGFSIIPSLKHHLVAFDDQETISESSQGDQMNESPPQESNASSEESNESPEESNESPEESNESPEESNESPEESNEEETSEEENQERIVRRVVLRDPSGNDIIFETSNHANVRIQRTFVMSNEEFRELADTVVQPPYFTTDKEEQPYEYCAFLIMFLTTLLSFSLWLSIINNGMEKMNR